jgi:hypothetical protein
MTGLPGRGELERFSSVTDADRALIARRRGDHSRLGFGLQTPSIPASSWIDATDAMDGHLPLDTASPICFIQPNGSELIG